MLQSPVLDSPPFDSFSSSEDGFRTAKVHIRRRQVPQALVVAPVIVIVDKSVDVHFEIARQVVMLQQNAILERLMPTLNLALCHRMIGRADQESAAQSPR